jgi:hypothetical protein
MKRNYNCTIPSITDDYDLVSIALTRETTLLKPKDFREENFLLPIKQYAFIRDLFSL